MTFDVQGAVRSGAEPGRTPRYAESLIGNPVCPAGFGEGGHKTVHFGC
jgi:hypothetical protein